MILQHKSPGSQLQPKIQHSITHPCSSPAPPSPAPNPGASSRLPAQHQAAVPTMGTGHLPPCASTRGEQRGVRTAISISAKKNPAEQNPFPSKKQLSKEQDSVAFPRAIKTLCFGVKPAVSHPRTGRQSSACCEAFPASRSAAN